MRLTRPKRPSRATNSCVLHAPAKLNLCLELLCKRSDGFHELRTVMAVIRLSDTLRVDSLAAGEPITLRLVAQSPQATGVPTDGSNLIVRALETLRREAGVEQGARVVLAKRIPSQAGLGGGSSDAAAALVAGNRVWKLSWPADRLAEIAGQLGSDIPFFVHALSHGGTPAALATGRGEQIIPVPNGLRAQPVVLVKPAMGLSTAQVFGQCQPEDYETKGTGLKASRGCDSVARALADGDFRSLSLGLANGLQAAARRVAPWLGAVRNGFEAAGCTVHQLSGSGSAYYGLTRTTGEARRLAARLRALRVGQVYDTTFG